MWQDAARLRQFYGTSLGQVARRMILRQARALWPDVRGRTVLGVGYAAPYLRPFRGEAARVAALMPAPMGACRWPPDGPNLAAVGGEAELPLEDLSVDRLLLAHCLECTEQRQAHLREIWRVLADGGRLLAVVPNRRSIWARADHTPFGHGFPYSLGQIQQLLRETMFAPLQTRRALYVPPLRRRVLLPSARAWEQVGSRWFQPLAGVLLVEAEKQVYGGVAGRPQERRRAYAPVPAAVPAAGLGNGQKRRSSRSM